MLRLVSVLMVLELLVRQSSVLISAELKVPQQLQLVHCCT